MSGMDRLFRALLFLILASYGFFFVHHAVRVIPFPVDVDNSEGYLLNEARLWSEGCSPYRDFHSPPWLVANYPPLYPLILSLPARWGGLSFAWGRALSALSVVGISVVIYLILWGRTRSHYWSSIGAFLFPSFFHVYSWGALHRVDLLGLLFAALGLLAVERGRRLVWPLLLFLAAFLTRQTYVAPVLAAGFVMAAKGRRRSAAWLAGGFFGSAVLLVGLASLLTGGEFFRHTILYNMNDYRWEDAWVYQLHLCRYTAVFAAFALGLVLVDFRERTWDWVPVYVFLGWLVSLTAGKVGSAENYLLELVLGISLAVPLFALRLRKTLSAGPRSLAFVVPLLLLFGNFQNFHVPRTEAGPAWLKTWGRRYDFAFTPVGGDYATAVALLAEGKRTAGPVLSQYAGWTLLSGHEVLFHPFLVRQLSLQGRFDERHLLSRVRAREFDAVLISDDLGDDPDPASFRLGSERFSGDFYRLLIEAGYVRTQGFFGKYFIYRPLGAEPGG